MGIILIQGDEEYLMERASIEESNALLSDKTIYIDYSKFSDDLYHDSFDNTVYCYIVKNCTEIPVIGNTKNSFIFILKPGLTDKSGYKFDRVLSFDKLKTTSDRNEVISWILKEGDQFNIDLSKVAGALFVNSGNRLRKISSEIQKLSVIVPRGSVVTPETAKSVFCFSSDLTPKSIIDAITSGKTSVALSFYDRLQESGDETGWILTYLHNFVIQTLRAKVMLSIGVNNIADALSVNPYIYNNFVVQYLNLWTQDSLKKSVAALSDADVMNRKGNDVADLILESEIIRLSEEASDQIKNRDLR